MNKFYQLLENMSDGVWAVDNYSGDGSSVASKDFYSSKAVADSVVSPWTSKPYLVKVVGNPTGNVIYKVTSYGYGDIGDRGSDTYYGDRETAMKNSQGSQPEEIQVHNSAEDASAFNKARQAKSNAAWDRHDAEMKARTAKAATERIPNLKAKLTQAMQILDSGDESAIKKAVSDLKYFLDRY